MKITLKQWGNSLAVRIPKVFAMQLGISEGKEVEMEVQDENIVISAKKEGLMDLVEQITPENVHAETETGYAIGNEIL